MQICLPPSVSTTSTPGNHRIRQNERNGAKSKHSRSADFSRFGIGTVSRVFKPQGSSAMNSTRPLPASSRLSFICRRRRQSAHLFSGTTALGYRMTRKPVRQKWSPKTGPSVKLDFAIGHWSCEDRNAYDQNQTQTLYWGLRGQSCAGRSLGVKTVGKIAREYQVHPGQVTQWKGVLRDRLPELFEPAERESADTQRLIAQLHEKIGQLTVEVDWLKKKSKQLGL